MYFLSLFVVNLFLVLPNVDDMKEIFYLSTYEVLLAVSISLSATCSPVFIVKSAKIRSIFVGSYEQGYFSFLLRYKMFNQIVATLSLLYTLTYSFLFVVSAGFQIGLGPHNGVGTSPTPPSVAGPGEPWTEEPPSACPIQPGTDVTVEELDLHQVAQCLDVYGCKIGGYIDVTNSQSRLDIETIIGIARALEKNQCFRESLDVLALVEPYGSRRLQYVFWKIAVCEQNSARYILHDQQVIDRLSKLNIDNRC